ncbi:MAG: hypothetical protein FWH44_04330 [Methanomassiliicoccaceae archaeon]|nr:hypothetical protein [Methanomassiliicoccaceae archaeon]
MIRLELKISYNDVGSAETVFRALEPDNDKYVASEIKGSEIIFVISSGSAGTLRNAADDLLACVKIAESSLGLSDAVPDLDGDALSE